MSVAQPLRVGDGFSLPVSNVEETLVDEAVRRHNDYLAGKRGGVSDEKFFSKIKPDLLIKKRPPKSV